MKVKFRCKCGKRMKAFTNNIGKNITCPFCKKRMFIPELHSSLVTGLECFCGTKFSPQEKQCPSCKKQIADLLKPLQLGETAERQALKPSKNKSPHQITAFQISTKIKVLWFVCCIITLASSLYIAYNWKFLMDSYN